MTRYFMLEDDNPFAESVQDQMIWYVPPHLVRINVMQLATSLCVRDSKGGVLSGDDFWDSAGALTWNETRINQGRYVHLERLAVHA